MCIYILTYCTILILQGRGSKMYHYLQEKTAIFKERNFNWIPKKKTFPKCNALFAEGREINVYIIRNRTEKEDKLLCLYFSWIN